MCVSSPSGSTKIWCDGLSAKRTILSSTDGQYRGPTPSILPEYIGDSCSDARMMSWVSSRVLVMWQETCCGCSARSPIKENTGAGVSPGCSCMIPKFSVLPSSRGGVPVLSRATRNGISRSRSASRIEGASPARPPGRSVPPTRMRPPRNVPTVSTIELAVNDSPSAVTAPTARPPSTMRSMTLAAAIVRPGWASSSVRIACL